MKKTLIITLEYPPTVGGIATYVNQFASSLPAEQVVVLAPPIESSSGYEDKQPFRVYRKKLLFPKGIWPRWLRLFLHVRRIVKTEHIQHLHVHHLLPVGYVALLMKKLFGISYVIFSHGTDIAMAGATPWKRRMARMIARHALQIFVNSHNLQDRLLAVFPEFSSSTTVLYPCPDPDFFLPSPKEKIEKLKEQYALEGKKVLLTVARFDEGKGFPHLIRIMPEILRHNPHIVWMIIGDGSNEKREEIIRAIQQQHLQNIVRFVGKVPHTELKTYYSLADVFVLLTHPDSKGKEEGLGLVFLEAATAGLPIVAGKSGGVEEAVIHGQTGLIVDVLHTPHTIAEAILTLLDDSAYARALGKAGQERIRQEFQWEQQLARISSWL